MVHAVSLVRCAAALALALCVTWAPANAATVRPLDVPALTEASDVVALGRVVDRRVGIGSFDRITTWWTIAIDDVWHAEAESLRSPTTVVVRQWAGELDGVVESVPGDARVALGDYVVLFARGDAPDDLTFTALAQSVFHVEPAVPAALVNGWAEGGAPLSVEPLAAGPLGWAGAPGEGARSVQFLERVAFYNAGDVTHGHGETWTLARLRAAVEAAGEGAQ